MQIHVVGAGGIGCAVGHALRTAGWPVVFVEANPRKVAAGRAEGVAVEGHPTLQADFLAFDDWRPSPGMTVLLCTKCYDNPAVLAKIPANVPLVPIQNGFDAELASRSHEWEGIASFVSECDRDRPRTRITRPGDLHLGLRTNGSELDPEMRALAGALQTTRLFRVRLVSRIEPIKYAKLLYNAAISPLAAAAGIDNGQLLSHPAARRLFFGMLQENYSILKAADIVLGKVGPFHPRTVAWILRRKRLAGLMARAFEPSLRGTYCSMAGEIQTGRTELDNYNGHLIRIAERTGAPCPLNRAVYDLVSDMTAARAQPRIGLLQELIGRRRETAATVLDRSGILD